MKRRVKTIFKAGRPVARVAFGPIQEIRRALTVEGDIRSEVAFQNDVNAILAVVGKLTALGPDLRADSEDVVIDVTPLPEEISTPQPVTTAPVRRARS